MEARDPNMNLKEAKTPSSQLVVHGVCFIHILGVELKISYL